VHRLTATRVTWVTGRKLRVDRRQRRGQPGKQVFRQCGHPPSVYRRDAALLLKTHGVTQVAPASWGTAGVQLPR